MTFNELKVGQKASVQKTFTAADLTLFAGVSLDVNPIHMSGEYAKNTVFGKRIVHGILTSGLISAVLANKLPGPGTIYLGQDLRFVAPVFVGDPKKGHRFLRKAQKVNLLIFTQKHSK